MAIESAKSVTFAFAKKKLEEQSMADRECEQRVTKMEEVYNRCAAGTRALQEALQGWEGNLNDFFALMEYYGSEEWYKDREAVRLVRRYARDCAGHAGGGVAVASQGGLNGWRAAFGSLKNCTFAPELGVRGCVARGGRVKSQRK